MSKIVLAKLADDEDEEKKDAKRLRVPMVAMDAVQRDVAQRKLPARDEDKLERAYQQSKQRLSNQWRQHQSGGSAKPESKGCTYEQSVERLTNAWRKPHPHLVGKP